MLLSRLLQCGIWHQNERLGHCHRSDGCCTLQVLLLLAEHLAQWATSPAFPEMSHLVLLQLRKVVALKTDVQDGSHATTRPSCDCDGCAPISPYVTRH